MLPILPRASPQSQSALQRKSRQAAQEAAVFRAVETIGPEADLTAFRGFLDAQPGQAGKPIWLTEFGVVWAFEGYQKQKLDDGRTVVVPSGRYRDDLVSDYLRRFAAWLSGPGANLGIERWFVYASYGPPEPYARPRVIEPVSPAGSRASPSRDRGSAVSSASKQYWIHTNDPAVRVLCRSLTEASTKSKVPEATPKARRTDKATIQFENKVQVDLLISFCGLLLGI